MPTLNSRTPTVLSLGEIVVDLFGPTGSSLQAADRFTPAPGGAPANVAVALARLGVPTGFVGAVGNDPFGHGLIDRLKGEGVDTTRVQFLDDVPTTLAVVASPTPTQQEFILYRGADAQLTLTAADRSYFATTQLLVYGSVTLSAACREAAAQAIDWIKDGGGLVVFDANLRPALWSDLDVARDGTLRGVDTADVCKVNETELDLLSGGKDIEAGSRWLLDRGVQLVLVTLGARGTYFDNGRSSGWVPAFPINALDTTGSGDAFLAATIAGVLDTSLDLARLDEGALANIVRFANAAGALNATSLGAMTSLPTRDAVLAFLEQVDRDG